MTKKQVKTMSILKKVHIITDSGCDLTPAILEGREIEILKMPVIADGKPFEVNDENDLMKMYELMREGVVFSTAHASYYDILSSFTRCARENIPAVFVGLSSGLTSQHNAATMALREVTEEYPNARIEVIDSASATIGYGRAVIMGYDKAQSGAGLEEVVNTIINELNHTEHLFSVWNLEFLVRGGRLSKVAGMVGDALSIRPVINIDDCGKLITTEKIRGDKKLLAKLADITSESLNVLTGQDVWIVEGQYSETTEKLIEKINKNSSPNSIRVYKMGPVIAAHTGPDVIGIVYKNPLRNKGIRPVCHDICVGERICNSAASCEMMLSRA